MNAATVIVLGGGPDAEREVSIESATSVARGIEQDGSLGVRLEIIDEITPGMLEGMDGDVIFPALHGPLGEGGPMQDVLEADGRAYVGSGPGAARLAMDKLGTKLVASALGMRTPEAACVNPADDGAPLELPLVVKPVHEGSSVGLRICRDRQAWDEAIAMVRDDLVSFPARTWMAERMVVGRELSVCLLDRGHGLDAIGIVEIAPAGGVYDFEAKYQRDDTRYTVSPELPEGVADSVSRDALTLARGLGVRHLGRVDVMLDAHGVGWVLEVNTMPGFTAHSLVPQAALAVGIEMPALCAGLARTALGAGARAS